MTDTYDVILVKGDTLRWSSFFAGITYGNTFDFRGCTLTMQVRSGYDPQTLLASYSKYIDTEEILFYPKGLTGGLSAATGGTVYLCIGSSQSDEFTTDRICKYDLKVYQPNLQDTVTLLRGNVQVLSNVTN